MDLIVVLQIQGNHINGELFKLRTNLHHGIQLPDTKLYTSDLIASFCIVCSQLAQPSCAARKSLILKKAIALFSYV